MALNIIYTTDTAGCQEKLKDEVLERLRSNFSFHKSTFNWLKNQLFQNPDGLTINDAYAAFGADAGAVKLAKDHAAAFINGIIAKTVDPTPPGGQVETINQDGTVTVA